MLTAGAIALWARQSWSWGVALGTTTFSILFTVLGLSITVSSHRSGDVVYHSTVLATLLVIMGLSIRIGRRTRRAGPGHARPA